MSSEVGLYLNRAIHNKSFFITLNMNRSTTTLLSYVYCKFLYKHFLNKLLLRAERLT